MTSVAFPKMRPALQLANACNDSGSESSSEEEVVANVPATPPPAPRKDLSVTSRDNGYVGSPAWLSSPSFSFEPPLALPDMPPTQPIVPPTQPIVPPAMMSFRRMRRYSCPDTLDKLDFELDCMMVRRFGTQTVGYIDAATQTADCERRRRRRQPVDVRALNPAEQRAELPPAEPDLGKFFLFFYFYFCFLIARIKGLHIDKVHFYFYTNLTFKKR